MLGERRGGDHQRIRRVLHIDGAAHRRRFFSDLPRGSALGAFNQQRSGRFGKSAQVRRIEAGSGVEREAHRDQRKSRIFEQNHRQAIGQLGFKYRREMVRGKGRGFRRLGAIDSLAGKETERYGEYGGVGQNASHFFSFGAGAGTISSTALFSGTKYFFAMD